MPRKVCFMDMVQLDKFVNQICSCNTPGCRGLLVPASVRCSGLGGAVSISYLDKVVSKLYGIRISVLAQANARVVGGWALF
jgi:hypothetical protein